MHVAGQILVEAFEVQIGGDYALTKRLSFAFGVLGGHFAASPRAAALVGFAYDFK